MGGRRVSQSAHPGAGAKFAGADALSLRYRGRRTKTV
jgi:hypothetical protein